MQKIKNIYHLACGFLASVYFGFPAWKLTVVGVTGTDGKTTTVHLIAHILKTAGKKVSLISSIGAQIAEQKLDTGFHVTTPSVWQVQKYLKKMVNAGSEFAILEVTSHGLDQNRVAFISFEVGVLTNVTSEHLDYHKTFENYLLAKAKLFQIAKVSILNADDSSFEVLKKKVTGKLTTYGIKNQADFNLNTFSFKLKISGDYNYYNGLAAAACCDALGVRQQRIKKALGNFLGLPGRMEEVKNNLGIKIYIDFAHTANGLEQALKTLRSQLTVHGSRLIAVFGAAGERDKLKRPLMGEISAKLSGLTIITAEDPRSEDPDQIASQILSGVQEKGGILGKTVFIETNRKKAIELAIKLAKKGDIVAIFGKGAEISMAYGKKEYPWSDQEAAKEVIKTLDSSYS